MKRLWQWLPNLWIHPVSAIGTVLTTVTGFMLVFVLATDLAGAAGNVYATGFLVVALPFLFVLGLLLIPLGIWLEHRRVRKGGVPHDTAQALADLFVTKTGRRKLFVIGALTLVNVIILSAVGNRALHYMDSPQFCGMACHTVMQPEYDTYKESAHARVACVDCHIGPGASFAVKSKIDGLRQVWRTITDTYDRPVPVPVHTLRPSRDTCEQCHWPDKFHGNRVLKRVHVQDDKENSREITVLSLKVGGRDEVTGEYHGIHWHVSSDHEVRYEALDEKREVIGKITVFHNGEVVREYLPKEAAGAAVETRSMDCIDCHNRPTHVFDASPSAALDRGFATRMLDASVPWLRKVAEPVLAKEGRARDGVEVALRQDLEAAYREQHAEDMPDPAALDKAAAGLANLWRLNIYPERNVTWGTYKSHLGHTAEPSDRNGCWRCHNGTHSTADGKRLSKDCELCHEMLAQDDDPNDLDDTLQILIRNP